MKPILRKSFRHMVRKHRVLRLFSHMTVRKQWLSPSWMLSQPARQFQPLALAIELSNHLTGSPMWAPYYDARFLQSMAHP